VARAVALDANVPVLSISSVLAFIFACADSVVAHSREKRLTTRSVVSGVFQIWSSQQKLVATGGDYLDGLKTHTRQFTRKMPAPCDEPGNGPHGLLLAIRVVSMNLKTVAVMVPVLGLAWAASVERLVLPEAMWLAVWGVGLMTAVASLRGLPRGADGTHQDVKRRNFATRLVKLARA
jgi:hypothetical protein